MYSAGSYGNASGSGQSFCAAQATSKATPHSVATRYPMTSPATPRYNAHALENKPPPPPCLAALRPNPPRSAKTAFLSQVQTAVPAIAGVLFLTVFLIGSWQLMDLSCVTYALPQQQQQGQPFSCSVVRNGPIGSIIPELSVACVAAGWVVSWLFRHVRYRLREQQQQQRSEALVCQP